jgi:hypothetical protein
MARFTKAIQIREVGPVPFHEPRVHAIDADDDEVARRRTMAGAQDNERQKR